MNNSAYYRLQCAFTTTRRDEAPLVKRAEMDRHRERVARWRERVKTSQDALDAWLAEQKKPHTAALRNAKIDALAIGETEKAILRRQPDSDAGKRLAQKHKALAISDGDCRRVFSERSPELRASARPTAPGDRPYGRSWGLRPFEPLAHASGHDFKRARLVSAARIDTIEVPTYPQPFFTLVPTSSEEAHMDNSGGSDPDFQNDESMSLSGRSGKPSQERSPGMFGRLVRRLRRILLLWLVISIPGVYLVYMLIEPTYDASSILRIEPSPDLFGPTAKGIAPDFGQYLETQRTLILSNRVLEPAIAYLTRLPSYPRSFAVIRDSADPKVEVHKQLRVDVIPGTFLIQVSFSSPNAIEAAEVVNQVVFAFEQQNKEFNVGTNAAFRTNYKIYLNKLNGDISDKQNVIITLAKGLERQASKSTERGNKPRAEEGDVARATSRVDELMITFIKEELTSLYSMKDSVRRKLEQLIFESQEGAPRVEVVDAAPASKTPQSDSRSLWMMVLPPVVLFMLLGFFLVLDARPQARPAATRDQDLL